MPELTNPRAERVKAVRALAGRSARLRHGQFLVEGPQSVREAVAQAAASGGRHRAGPVGYRVRDLYLTAASAERHADIVGDAGRGGVRVSRATPEVLAAMSQDAQEVLAVADIRRLTVADVVPARPRLVAVLAQVRDPGNAGTVIRAADAAGADAVVLTQESVDLHNPKVVRATAGSLFHVPVATEPTLEEVIDALRDAGLTVLAADGAGEHDLDDLLDLAAALRSHPAEEPLQRSPDLTLPTAWVFGNEARGLLPAERALADAVVRVPIRGRAESLNLATAATVCLYASSRAQRPASGAVMPAGA